MISIPLFFTGVLLTVNTLYGYQFYLNSKKEQILRVAELSRALFENRLYSAEWSSLHLQLDRFIGDSPIMVTVFDSRGQLIYPRPNNTNNMFRGSHRVMPNNVTRLPRPEFLQNVQQVGNGLLYITRQGVGFNIDILGYQETLSNRYELQISYPLAQIQENAAIANRLTWLVAGIVTLVCILLAFILARYFTKPIVEISRATRKLANSNLVAEVPLRGNNEFTDLARDINWLSEQLRAAIAVLAEQNKRLKADVDLGKKNEIMRKKFISDVSHELKSPLFLISGYTEMLTQLTTPPLSADGQRYAKVISEEAEKMNNLIKSMLDLAQLESGSFKIESLPFAIDLLCLDIAKRYRPIFAGRQISLITKVEELTVNADIERTEQVITNYLNNALDHVAGPKNIELAVYRHNDKARLEVFNSGSHIAEDKAGDIWQAFYKIDDARQRDIGGSGIGLSIVAAIGRATGNNFGFSNINDGVLFWFEVDLAGSASL